MTSEYQMVGDVWLLTLRVDRLPDVFVTEPPMAMALQIVNRHVDEVYIRNGVLYIHSLHSQCGIHNIVACRGKTAGKPKSEI